MESIPCIVIGGGVIGLAIAKSLSQHMECCVLEQAIHIGTQTSSRNSGVIHAGIYYPSDFLKTTLCVAGNKQLYAYCQTHNISHQACGKLIIAHSEDEVVKLKALQSKAASNGVELVWLDHAALSKKEPRLQAHAALYSASSGIIDVAHYLQQLSADIENNGSYIACQQQATAITKNEHGFIVEINHKEKIQCQYLVNAAGLQAQTIAQFVGSKNTPKLYYCKGQYFAWHGESPFSHLIYPLPLANNTGLGIHATLDTAGQLRFGPDANYCKTIDYSNDDSAKIDFLQAIRRYFPEADVSRLKADFCGIRPKLSAQGQAMQDFVIQDANQHGITGLIQLFGIESPGLTASLAIGDYVAERLLV